MKKTKKCNDLDQYEKEARAAGLTYGQKQAQEYASAIKVQRTPAGYREAGEFIRKKWNEDL